MRLIDADELKNRLDEDFKEDFDYGGDALVQNKLGIVDLEIDNSPTIDAEPVKHAHWESHKGYARCSHCGCMFTAEWEYCGHRGAKMDEEDK